MKGIFALPLALLLALVALAGCAGEPVPPGSGPAPSASPEEPGREEYAPGAWVGENRFESPFWDLAYVLPEGWTAAAPQGPEDAAAAGGRLLSDEQRMQAERAFREGRSVNEMLASGGPDANILLVADSFAGVAGGDTLTPEAYAKVLAEELEALPGIVCEVKEETFAKTIGGQEYVVLAAQVEEYGVTQWYAMRKEGDYILTILCTFARTKTMEKALEGFARLDADLS